MKNNSTSKNLRIFLRSWSVACIAIMTINWSAFIFKFLKFNPGGSLHWFIWDDVYGHVGPMLFILYIIWSVYLFKAGNDPVRYKTFLDFTLWANVGHAIVMVPMALNDSMYHTKFLTDIPFILGLSIGIYVWQPSVNVSEA
ncbi:MAG: hypothetical protein ABIS36_16210 [Chryseolinea sp.]